MLCQPIRRKYHIMSTNQKWVLYRVDQSRASIHLQNSDPHPLGSTVSQQWELDNSRWCWRWSSRMVSCLHCHHCSSPNHSRCQSRARRWSILRWPQTTTTLFFQAIWSQPGVMSMRNYFSTGSWFTCVVNSSRSSFIRVKDTMFVCWILSSYSWWYLCNSAIAWVSCYCSVTIMRDSTMKNCSIKTKDDSKYKH